MKQLQHLSRLTDELHLLSLADAGQLTLNRQVFSLDELLREQAAWLKPQADDAGIGVSIDGAQPCPYHGDAFRPRGRFYHPDGKCAALRATGWASLYPLIPPAAGVPD